MCILNFKSSLPLALRICRSTAAFTLISPALIIVTTKGPKLSPILVVSTNKEIIISTVEIIL